MIVHRSPVLTETPEHLEVRHGFGVAIDYDRGARLGVTRGGWLLVMARDASGTHAVAAYSSPDVRSFSVRIPVGVA